MTTTLHRPAPAAPYRPSVATANGLVGQIALRPRGGTRRSSDVATTTKALVPTTKTPRHRDRAAGVYIDAFDAAAYIARWCNTFDVAQIVEHPEIANMAIAEAETILDARIQRGWFSSWRARQRRAELVEAREELDVCAKVLGQCQRSGLLRFPLSFAA